MTTIAQQLDNVLALSEKATPGEWAATVGGHVKKVGGVVIVDPNRMRGETMHANADFIAALANLIREHGPAIRAAVGGDGVVIAHRLHTPGGKWQWMNGMPSKQALDDSKNFVWEMEYAYASPTATVDVWALRELVEKLRTRGPSSPMTFNIGTATVNKTPYEVGLAERKLIANELAAIIGGAP